MKFRRKLRNLWHFGVLLKRSNGILKFDDGVQKMAHSKISWEFVIEYFRGNAFDVSWGHSKIHVVYSASTRVKKKGVLVTIHSSILL